MFRVHFLGSINDPQIKLMDEKLLNSHPKKLKQGFNKKNLIQKKNQIPF